MARKYIIREENYNCNAINRKTYGVALVEICDNIMMVVDSVADISTDKKDVEKLIRELNELNLEPLFLRDVIYEFLVCQ